MTVKVKQGLRTFIVQGEQLLTNQCKVVPSRLCSISLDQEHCRIIVQ